MRICQYILTGILFLSIHIAVIAQSSQTSLEELGLHGQVESLITERYKVVDLPGKKIKKIKDCFDSQSYCSSFMFDRNGLLIQEFEYDNEDIIYTHKSTYNDKGNRLNYDSYTKKNNILQHNYHRISIYNEDNRLESFSVYIGKDTLAHRIFYQYNPQGQRIEAVNYNAQGNLIGRYSYVYDQHGNKIKEQGYDNDFRPTLSVQYDYDTLTHLKTKELHYTGEDLTYQRIFHYNDDRLLSEQIEFDNINNIENKTTYQYNMSQQLMETIITHNNQLVKRSVYEYDHQGNCIQENTYVREKNKWVMKYIIEHTIKYY